MLNFETRFIVRSKKRIGTRKEVSFCIRQDESTLEAVSMAGEMLGIALNNNFMSTKKRRESFSKRLEDRIAALESEVQKLKRQSVEGRALV